MAQQIIDTGATANDGTGEPLRDAFTAVNENFTEIYTAGPVGSNVQISGNTITTLQTNQNLTLNPNGIGKIQANATIIPSIDSVYDVGAPTALFDSMYARYYYGNGAFLTGVTATVGNVSNITNGTSTVAITTPDGNVTVAVDGVANVAVFARTGVYVTGEVSATGNITGTNIDISGNVTGGYFSGNGAGLTDVTATNVGTLANLSVTGNVVANYFVGNGSALTGVVATDIGILANLSVTGNVAAGNVSTTGNVAANYFVGNGSALTGVVATGIGVLANLSVTGNVVAGNFVGNGSALTSTMTDRGSDLNNWNTMTQMGVYTVNRVSWSGTVGTPLDSQVFVGLVEVMNSTNTALSQIFYPGTVESGNVKIQWNRTYWAGSWSSWIKIINDDQVVLGGTY